MSQDPAGLAIQGFDLLEELAPGPAGRVFRAVQQRLSREVVLKLVDAPEGAPRLQREARVAARLNHPNLLRLVAYGTCPESGAPYLAYERVEGTPLEDVLARVGRLPLRAALGLGVGVAGALRALEDNGLVHRDVCPRTILVNAAGEARLVDLGLTRRTTESPLTRPGVFLSSPRYAAPELIRGDAVDVRADLYSLGITLWHALAGRPPFEEKEFLALARRHQEEDVPDVRRVAPEVSPAAALLLAGLHARGQAERYTTAQAVVIDLLRLLEGQEPLGPVEAAKLNPRLPRRFASPELGQVLSGPAPAAEAPPALVEDDADPLGDTSVTRPLVRAVTLELRRGGAKALARRFEQAKVTIGRSKDCDLRIDDPVVSRHHATLDWVGEQLLVTSLGHTNPLLVNGRRVKVSAPLKDGDRVDLAEHLSLHVRIEAPDDEPTPETGRPRPPSKRISRRVERPAPPAPRRGTGKSSQRLLPPGVEPAAPAPASDPPPPVAAGAPPAEEPDPGMSGVYPRVRVQLPSEPVPLADVRALLSEARRRGASDLHLAVGLPPFLRLNGDLLPQGAPLAEAQVAALASQLLDPDQREAFSRSGDIDLCFVGEDGRYRANVCLQRTGVAVSARIVAGRVPTPQELDLPPEVLKLTSFAQGLVLVSGPLGAGKTTSMMALVEHINRARPDHVITIEDPIEFLLRPARCQVSQRELGRHTASFEAALRAALREDPDVVVIGDLRDRATASLAVSAAETGHLVFASMPALSAAKTLDKLIDLFPAEEQPAVRTMVSESLRGILCQRLLPGARGGRMLAIELLLNSVAVANIVREGGAQGALQSAMQLGRAQGMRTLEQSLGQLEQAGHITREVAAAARRW